MTITYLIDAAGKVYAELDDLDPKTARIAIPPGHCVITDERFAAMSQSAVDEIKKETGLSEIKLPVTKTPMEALGCVAMVKAEPVEEKP